MTGPEYVAGAPVPWWTDGGRGPRNWVVSVVHAVVPPVVDNPVTAVCGALVVANADVRWYEVWGVTRCAACRRTAGDHDD